MSLRLALLLIAGCTAGCTADRPAAVPAPEPAVQVASREVQDEESKRMLGVLVPEVEVTLVSAGFARLARIEAPVGGRVDEGEVVAAMDVEVNRARLASAVAAWEASKAELERSTLELDQAQADRAEAERLEGYIASTEIRDQRYTEQLSAARTRAAAAALQQQRSQVDEVSVRLREAELRAPFSGTVARHHASPGATLAAGDPVLRLISDARRVRFAVPEGGWAALQPGAPVRIHFVEEGIEAGGEVLTIFPEIEAGTRLVLAEARLLGPPLSTLRVGSVAHVRFESEHP